MPMPINACPPCYAKVLARMDHAVQSRVAGLDRTTMPTAEGLARGCLDVLRYTVLFQTSKVRCTAPGDPRSTCQPLPLHPSF